MFQERLRQHLAGHVLVDLVEEPWDGGVVAIFPGERDAINVGGHENVDGGVGVVVRIHRRKLV